MGISKLNDNLALGERPCHTSSGKNKKKKVFFFLNLFDVYPVLLCLFGELKGDYEDVVLTKIENELSTSLHAIEIPTGVPKCNAHRILKRYEFHPCHVQHVQNLLPRD